MNTLLAKRIAALEGQLAAVTTNPETREMARRMRANERRHTQLRRAFLMITVRSWESLGEHERASRITVDTMTSEFMSLPEQTREQLRRAAKKLLDEGAWKDSPRTRARPR